MKPEAMEIFRVFTTFMSGLFGIFLGVCIVNIWYYCKDIKRLKKYLKDD